MSRDGRLVTSLHTVTKVGSHSVSKIGVKPHVFVRPARDSMVPFPFGNISSPDIERNSGLQSTIWENPRLLFLLRGICLCLRYTNESEVLNMAFPETQKNLHIISKTLSFCFSITFCSRVDI